VAIYRPLLALAILAVAACADPGAQRVVREREDARLQVLADAMFYWRCEHDPVVIAGECQHWSDAYKRDRAVFIANYGGGGEPMNDRRYAALLNEVAALRMVLVHFLARQPSVELAAISSSISREHDEHSVDVERALAPSQATIDEMLLQAEVVGRRRDR
jgi:hypothetical protein